MTPTDGRRPAVVMVDAFSTGALLTRRAAVDHAILHVRSRLDIPTTFAATLPEEVFDLDLVYPGDAARVLARLRSHAPVAVIAASEFGVEVADEIAARLGLRGNSPALSTARRDKDVMMRTLAAAGVRTPRQFRSKDPADLVAWRAREQLGRVVVKPLDSAGSEDVFVCDTDEDLIDAAQSILTKTNLMLRVNESVLVQEFLTGTEFVVNTVSRDGRHWFTDAWVCTKLDVAGRHRIYSSEDLLAADDPRLAGVLRYVTVVLDALGVQHGPAHTELIVTEDGPCLLETGARVSGLASPAALDRSTGANQIDLTLDCFLGGGGHLTARPERYPRYRYARCLNLVARRTVPFPARAIRAAAENLPAFDSLRFRLADGALTRPTVDLNSSPGVVFLVHEEQREIDEACRALRDVERRLL